jgi:translation initiation factor IF-2
MAEKDQVSLATFDIIYDLIEHIRKEMASLLEAEVRREVLGKVKILALFKHDTKSQVVGGRVMSGRLVRGALCEIQRNGKAVMVAKVGQVQQNKEDVTEVNEGSETGMRIDVDPKNAVDIAVGDILEIFQEEKIARSL